jgi:hypothetical protein
MCGAVRYESTAEPVAFVKCHCRECQYVSGGAAASVVVVPKDGFSITKGDVKGFSSTSAKGNQVTRKFCPDCGTPMFSELAANPAVWVIKAGTMDDASWLTPGATLWTSTAQPWAHIDEALPQFEKDPPG